MDDVDGRIIAEAERRGRELDEPRASSARYDAATGLVHVALTNGCLFAFPARRMQGLDDAGDAELGEIEILGRGLGLRWEALDVDASVPGLLAGLFGTRAWMDRERAARAGAARSPANAEAARRNGTRGGRPPKSASSV